MPLDSTNHDFVNIVPQNNLRLPDALTIKHGPAPLLSRFTIAGDRFYDVAGARPGTAVRTVRRRISMRVAERPDRGG